MHADEYKNNFNENLPFYDLYLRDYIKRLEFARDNGCNNVMITGSSEPQQNRHFLMTFGLLNQIIGQPFRNIEMQTTGTRIDENYLRFLRNHVGVSTMSISLSSFDSDKNAEIVGMHEKVDIEKLCAEIKKYDFTLRLSLNMNKSFEGDSADGIMKNSKELGADQITFRVLYSSEKGTPQDIWVEHNKVSDKLIEDIKSHIETKGRFLETLEFGAQRYSVDGMSTVVDDDCMNTTAKDKLKYLILRENCKLYTKWDDKGSLLF
jgi:hypothetical protein